MKPNYIIIPLIVFIVASLGSFLTGAGMDWDKIIKVPGWTPAGWLIGLVWTIIFILSAFSALIFWKKSKRNSRFWVIFFIFLINAGLNVFWSFLFFYQELIGPAFWEALLLDISVIALIVLIWPISKLASFLLVPYALWTAFASFLTFIIWTLNL